MVDYKAQHYVPRFYLKNFSKDDIINVYDKSKSHSFQQNVDSVGMENFFYTSIERKAFEKKLSSIEGMTSTIIKKIIDNESITSPSKEKHILKFRDGF